MHCQYCINYNQPSIALVVRYKFNYLLEFDILNHKQTVSLLPIDNQNARIERVDFSEINNEYIYIKF